MYETHKTAIGHEILIAEMEDEHLLRTINLFCRRLAQASEIMNREENLTTDKVIAHLQPRYSAASLMAKARQELTEIDQKIAPYIVEAALRGLTVSHPPFVPPFRGGQRGGAKRQNGAIIPRIQHK